MKPRRMVALLLIVVMMLLVTSCADTNPPGPGPDNSGPTAPQNTGTTPENGGEPEGEEELMVAAVLPGSINDNGWNAGAYAGLKHLESLGSSVAYTENVAASDMEEYMRGYGNLGYDIIIAHGSQFADAVKKVAVEFPETIFLITNADVDNSQEPNVACFGAASSGYLAGIVAGALTKTGVVAGLGGEQSLSITPTIQLFEAGAKQVNPDIKVFTGFIGSLTDADKAKEMTLNYINKENADIVFASANSAGLGVIQAAHEQGVYAIGFNSDQYQAAPDAVVVSILRNFPGMFESMYNSVKDKTFEPKVYMFGLENNGTVLSDWHGWDAKLPAEALEKIEQTLQDIVDGKIVIPLEH